MKITYYILGALLSMLGGYIIYGMILRIFEYARLGILEANTVSIMSVILVGGFLLGGGLTLIYSLKTNRPFFPYVMDKNGNRKIPWVGFTTGMIAFVLFVSMIIFYQYVSFPTTIVLCVCVIILILSSSNLMVRGL